jgi:lipoprotein-releasing system ATP-binding protein
MHKLLKVDNLFKNYKTKTENLNILKGIDFEMDYNQSIAITGESGSGKSTFLNMIGGLDSVTSGNIYIDGTDITALNEDEITFFRNKKIGFIFQSHYLIEEFNSLENVMIPFLINNFNKKEAKNEAVKLLEYMGMQNRMKSYPSRLSGGEKQRVAIARAYINNPSLILADEPTGNLDEENAAKVLNLLFNIAKREKHSLIIVSHSSQIVNMADSCYHLGGGFLIRQTLS